ncbi:MAG: type IV pilus biogenesis/stability protein PilW [Nevskiales bacterium]
MRTRGSLWLALLLLAGCATQGSQSGRKENNPRDAARINAQLGIEYLRKGDLELARGKLEKAVELDAKNAEAQGALALLYASTGELRKAEKHYDLSLGLQPDDPSVLNNYGVMLCSQGKYDKADLQFRRASQNTRYQAPEVALTNAGVCARKMPDNAKAETHFREALKHNPNFADALGQMALLSADQASYLNARGFLQRYQSLQAPMTREMLLLGIRIELALGDRDAAQRYAQTLRSEYPESVLDSEPDEGARATGNSSSYP